MDLLMLLSNKGGQPPVFTGGAPAAPCPPLARCAPVPYHESMNQPDDTRSETEALMGRPRLSVAVGPRTWTDRLKSGWSKFHDSGVWLPLVAIAAGLAVNVTAKQLHLEPLVLPPVPGTPTADWHGTRSPADDRIPIFSPGVVLNDGKPPVSLTWPDADLAGMRAQDRPTPGQVVALIDRLESQWSAPNAKAHNDTLWTMTRTLCKVSSDDRYTRGGEVPGDDTDWYPEQRIIQGWRSRSGCDDTPAGQAEAPQVAPSEATFKPRKMRR